MNDELPIGPAMLFVYSFGVVVGIVGTLLVQWIISGVV